MSTTTTRVPSAVDTPAEQIRIDFLFFDLRTCSRCVGTDQNLEEALEVVRRVVQASGTRVELNKVQVESEAEPASCVSSALRPSA